MQIAELVWLITVVEAAEFSVGVSSCQQGLTRWNLLPTTKDHSMPIFFR